MKNYVVAEFCELDSKLTMHKVQAKDEVQAILYAMEFLNEIAKIIERIEEEYGELTLDIVQQYYFDGGIYINVAEVKEL